MTIMITRSSAPPPRRQGWAVCGGGGGTAVRCVVTGIGRIPSMAGVAGIAARPLADHIAEAMQRGNVGLARSLLADALERCPGDASLRNFACVLAPPVSRPVAAVVVSDAALNAAWSRKHSHLYRGRWIALERGRLIADAPSLSELRAALQIHAGDPVVFRVVD